MSGEGTQGAPRPAVSPQQLQARTRRFAVDIVRCHRSLPPTEEARILGRQLLRAGTSVGAHYRAACRPRSDADFIAKLGLAIEESDETAYWLDLLVEVRLLATPVALSLQDEADQLTRIFVASRETARRNARRRTARNQESRIKNQK